MPNRLITEKSPYLLQHAHNPVDWYPWGDEAFEEAKRRNVPVFLSIGYSSCHWCHVMERESFEDEETAAVLNRNFVSIKVDREERADIDHLYMEACVALTGSGGWPLSVFLNHDRLPFFTGTYFPKNDRYGMSGFISVLNHISSVWSTKRDAIDNSGREIISYLKQNDRKKESPDSSVTHLAYEQFFNSFDEKYGGFGNAPKFPSVSNLLFLLRYNITNPESDAYKMVDKTLNCMATGGIFDHLGGGFFRYSTDRKWLVPHFEKMLYDNAMLMAVYAEASHAINKKYEQVARRVASYCLSEMHGVHGAFFTAEDADSEGVEGKMYLFTPGEVIAALGEAEGEAFCRDYDITQSGNFEGQNIPNRIGKELIPDDSRLQRLFAYRSKRVHPFKDDKVTTSSNGLMIAALALSGRLMKEPNWITQAERAAEFIKTNLFVKGRLMARWRENEAAHPAVLDDYAYFLWGIIELYSATYKPEWLDYSLSLAREMITLFSDGHGGLYLSGNDISDLPIRQKNFRDGALPSGNGIAAMNFYRLSAMTENEELKNAADSILFEAYSELKEIPFAYTSHLCAAMLSENLVNITISAGADLDKMLSLVNGFYPFAVPCVVGEGYERASYLMPNAESKPPLSGLATAYVCDTAGCRPPLTDLNQLENLLLEVK